MSYRHLALGLPRSPKFLLGLLIAVLQGLFAVALLATSAWLISRCSEHPAEVYVAIAVVGVRTFAVGRAAFRYAERIVLHDAAFKQLSLIRPRLLRALIPSAPVGLAKLNRGEALQGVVADVDELQNLPLRVISPLLQSLVVSITSATFLAFFAPLAGLALLITTLLAIAISVPLAVRLGRTADRDTRGVKGEIASLSLRLIETTEVLAAYGWHQELLRQLGDAENRLIRLQRRNSLFAGITQATTAFLGAAATVLTAWYGSQLVAAGSQPGVMLAVFALVPMAVFDVLTNLQPVASAWNRYRVAAGNIDTLLATVPAVEVPIDSEGERASAKLGDFRELRLVDAQATYPDSEWPAISQVNLTLKPGDVTLIRGESGAGKSTIANVLLRFLNLSHGDYLINGAPVAEHSVADVRRLVGLIEQQPTVFSGTVKQNLELAKPGASDEELVDVLARVGLWSMFEARAGLSTYVGERGSTISGGEATRLGLARALLADRRVLIFDEPTANLDSATANQVMQQLLKAAATADRAVVIISHDSEMALLTTSEVVVEKPQRV